MLQMASSVNGKIIHVTDGASGNAKIIHVTDGVECEC